jgi:hypothetical protein
MLVWYFVFLWRIRLHRNHAAAVAVAAMLGGLLCGRAWGGYHSTSAFVGAIVSGCCWLALRRQLGSWLEVLEAGSSALPFAWIFVRAGCVVERAHPGLVTDSWLGLEFRDGTVRWDLALLELLWALCIAVLFLQKRLQLRHAVWLPGTLGLFRLAIQPLQVGPPDYVGPTLLLCWSVFVAFQRPGLSSTSTNS